MASVLIVDDDPRIRELLRRWLESAGYALRFAEDANAAVAALCDERPAVILCDVHMPGPNGLWLADRVRAVASTTAIVLATADDTVPPFESFRKGVVGYVLKPFQREQLVRAVAAGVQWSVAAVAGEARQFPVRRRQLPEVNR